MEYSVRWQEFDRQDRVVTKEKHFATKGPGTSSVTRYRISRIFGGSQLGPIKRSKNIKKKIGSTWK